MAMNESLLVKHVMTAIPVRLSVGESVQTALGIMQMHEVRHLPVVDGTELIGIVSERDLLSVQASLSHSGHADTVPVTEVCSFNKFQTEPDTPLADVLEQMAERHIGSALISQGGELLGIFTATDACRFWARHLRGESINNL
jgi:acetoin utilization protein AcuB